FFFQAEDGIRDATVTGVQTCALPIYFSQSLVQKPTTQAQAVTANGVNRVIYAQGNGSSLFSNPLLWVGIAVAVILVVVVVMRKRSEERRVGKECGCRWAMDLYRRKYE